MGIIEGIFFETEVEESFKGLMGFFGFFFSVYLFVLFDKCLVKEYICLDVGFVFLNRSWVGLFVDCGFRSYIFFRRGRI